MEKANFPKGPRTKSGGWICCVDDCHNNSKMMSFHVFPKNRSIALVWLSKLNLRNNVEYSKKRICHDHFNQVNEKPDKNSYQIYDEHSYAYVGSIHNHSELHKNLQKYTHHLERENAELKQTIENMQDHNTPKHIVENPDRLNFYTGFKDQKKYKMFASFIIQEGKKFLENSNPNFTESMHILDMDTQLFMTISRLRVGLLVVDLANKYNVSPATISKTFRFWINIIYVYFKQIPIWASEQLIVENLPECFKRTYPSTKIIFDATEIFIEVPGDCIVQSSTYSEYKAHNTVKGLLGISPNGFTTFISDLYPGRISDKELVLKSGILSMLKPGWAVMADRGFTIEEELRNVGCDLNIPPFARHVKDFQFNEEQEQITRDIASTRIHIERVIRNVKRYRILLGNVPNTISDQLNQIWFICCMLNNFTAIPLLDR